MTDVTVKCRPYFRLSKRNLREHLKAHLAGEGPWTVPGYLAHLGFTKGSLPGGGRIGILELDGGWVKSDVDAAFSSLGLPSPILNDISVDGTTNKGASGGDASVEVALDYQIAGQVYSWLVKGNPAAEIDMLWSAGIDTAAVKSASLGHAACSCSWGADELSWGTAGLATMQAACVTCTDAGTVFCAASGDNDADDGTGKPTVDAPASCPNSLACGGSSTPQSGASVIWNNNPGSPSGEGTGGGYSSNFPFQSFCTGPTGPGRMVSDVAGNADPDTGYDVVCMGQSQVVGGTSAVSPLWAGIIAAFGPKGQGLLAAKLWAAKATACTLVTAGTNGDFPADVCCGVGIPNGAGLVALLAGVVSPPPTPPVPPSPTPPPAPPAPTPPPPVPPTANPTCAQVVQAIATAFSTHWLLFEQEAVRLAAAAVFPLLSPTTAPTFEAVDAALAKAFSAISFRQEAIDAAAEAIDPLW